MLHVKRNYSEFSIKFWMDSQHLGYYHADLIVRVYAK